MDLDAFADAARSADRMDDLTRLTRDTLVAHGFNAFMFSGRAGDSGQAFLGECNRPYLERYHEKRRSVVDPVVAQVSASWLPVAWNCEDYIGCGSGPLSDLFEMSADVGYVRGISTPVHGPLGQKRILCTIYGGGRDELSKAWRPLGHELMVLGAHLAVAYERLSNATTAERIALTVRQRECLTWSAKGKTAWEVSRIIGISERTVNFHLQTAMGKLAASSKYHAWMKAVRLGLISA